MSGETTMTHKEPTPAQKMLALARTTVTQKAGRKPGYVIIGYGIDLDGWESHTPEEKQNYAETMALFVEAVLERKVPAKVTPTGVQVVIETTQENAAIFGMWCCMKDSARLAGLGIDDDLRQTPAVLARLMQRALNLQDDYEDAQKRAAPQEPRVTQGG